MYIIILYENETIEKGGTLYERTFEILFFFRMRKMSGNFPTPGKNR